MKRFEVQVAILVNVPDHYEEDNAVADVQFGLRTINGFEDAAIMCVFEEGEEV